MEKLSIGIELNKYSSLSVSKMPPPAQPRKRRKAAWEPAQSRVWGCSRQEWSLRRCHFPYTGHHGKIKVTEINFVGLQKDEQKFSRPPHDSAVLKGLLDQPTNLLPSCFPEVDRDPTYWV